MHSHSSNVFSIEDLECFLQGLDFFFSACNAVLIADTGVNATWLELIEIGESCFEFFLNAFEVLLVCLESLLLVPLLGSLVFNRSGLVCLVHLLTRS